MRILHSKPNRSLGNHLPPGGTFSPPADAGKGNACEMLKTRLTVLAQTVNRLRKNYVPFEPKKHAMQKKPLIGFRRWTAGVALIVIGLCLMHGPRTDEVGFGSRFFTVRRIRVAPWVCMAGYLVVGLSLLPGSYMPERKKNFSKRSFITPNLSTFATKKKETSNPTSSSEAGERHKTQEK
jgi:hypothetical protein